MKTDTSYIEKEGYWWNPDTPQQQVAGTLTFGSETDSELRLLGSFLGPDFMVELANSGVRLPPKLIVGLTSDGKRYSLINCLRSGVTISGFLVQKYLPNIVIEGHHFSNPEDILLEQLTLRISHLGEWYQKTGRAFEQKFEDDTLKGFSLSYEKPPEIIAKYGQGCLEFGHDVGVKFARFSGDYVISEEACVTVIPHSPLRLYDFLDTHLSPILNFFAICIGRALTIVEMRGKVSGLSEEKFVTLSRKQKKHRDYDKELLSHDMLATFPQLSDRLDTYLPTWVNVYNKIRPVMQLFFGNVLTFDTITPNWFLNAVQAAEAYHRYQRSGSEALDDEHTKRITQILSIVQEEHREWLETKLAYSNEKSLAKRLKELLNERKDLFDFSKSDIKQIANRIRELRVFFTHYTGDQTKKFGTGEEFYVLGSILRWTMTCCLLEEIGLVRQQVHDLVRANEDFLYFRSAFIKGEIPKFIEIKDIPPPKSNDGN